MKRLTWGEAGELADELNEAPNLGRRDLLGLIAQLPLISEKQLRPLLGLTGPASADRRLTFLLEAGLVGWVGAASTGGRPRRLFHLTDFGLAVVTCAQPGEVGAFRRCYQLTRAELASIIPRLPLVEATYDLLGTVVTTLNADAAHVIIERPWRRRYERLTAKNALAVELPLRVLLPWHDGLCVECLLLPDPGMFGAKSYRRLLRGMLGLRRAAGTRLPVLVVSTPDEGAASVWRAVLADVAQDLADAPLPAIVAARAELPERLGCDAVRFARPLPPADACKSRPLRRDDAPIPVVLGDPSTLVDARLTAHLALLPGDRDMIDLVGRYPLLTAADVAVLRQVPESEAERQCVRLGRKGFLREAGGPLSRTAHIDGTPGRPDRAKVHPNAPLMLTADGFAAAAGRCALPAAFVRRKILGADGSKPQQRREGRLRRHFEHTRGVVRVFIGLLRQAAENRARGGDDALLEWRSDVFCSWGNLQPDGYGVYRHRGRRYGFFLEFDRATERSRDYYGKFNAYYEYRDSAAYQRDYEGFPTILLITTGRQTTEARIAAAARDVGIGHPAPLPLLLTCTWRIQAKSNPHDLLGEIWRTAANHQRRYWQLGSIGDGAVTGGVPQRAQLTQHPTASEGDHR